MKLTIIFLLIFVASSKALETNKEKPALKMDIITTISCLISSHDVRYKIVDIMNAWETKDIYTIFGAIVHALPVFKDEIIRCLKEPEIRLAISDIIKMIYNIRNLK